jgi:hypothetical protein
MTMIIALVFLTLASGCFGLWQHDFAAGAWMWLFMVFFWMQYDRLVIALVRVANSLITVERYADLCLRDKGVDIKP